jgi:hypothetical protein
MVRHVRRLEQVRRQLHPAAVAPAFPAEDQQQLPPIAWAPADWQAADERQRSTPLFHPRRLADATAQFDRDAFLRDGFWVLPRLMSEDTCRQWSAALLQAQAIHDAFVVAEDWHSSVPWPDLGLTPPAPGSVPPAELRSAAQGRSQELPGVLAKFGTDWQERGEVMRRHGLIPEYFLSGYVPFLMDVACHPEMEALHRCMMFGKADGSISRRVLWNHCHLLSRAPGYPGGSWHSHPNRDGTDSTCGAAHDVAEYDRLGLNVIFTFACEWPSGSPLLLQPFT